MSVVTYTTVNGDMVDAIAHRYYGGRSGAFEFLLSNNRGLASKGMELPAGVVIQLPEMPSQPSASTGLDLFG